MIWSLIYKYTRILKNNRTFKNSYFSIVFWIKNGSFNFHRFGERMSNVKMENEKRTTRYLDRTSSNSSNKIVSRKHILAAKTLGSRSNDLHRYSHAHKVPANSQAENSRANAASVPQNSMASREAHNQASNPSTTLINGYQPLNGSHPMLDRNKHKKPQNPEIMKRSLR